MKLFSVTITNSTGGRGSTVRAGIFKKLQREILLFLGRAVRIFIVTITRCVVMRLLQVLASVIFLFQVGARTECLDSSI
ncbi:hypothetical protein A359_09380 [secondary endosymbiont of Ctenarytaina eucalypti]|uniref:Uncharacterized protein n=1 Tax=secondary endosymbiont of Ctenarytaina eucalypti TaxID=1199245 RepID=J3TY78_9ENTR|nr:hypothetical protein A359_09380 [secondary endosymbiont of Ctenarytaina eucalypti]